MVGGMTTPLQVSKSGHGRFPDDRFGMFVHWGLYSLTGASKWAMFHERYYSIDGHEALAGAFVATIRLDLS
jgi:hypothetical protein